MTASPVDGNAVGVLSGANLYHRHKAFAPNHLDQRCRPIEVTDPARDVADAPQLAGDPQH